MTLQERAGLARIHLEGLRLLEDIDDWQYKEYANLAKGASTHAEGHKYHMKAYGRAAELGRHDVAADHLVMAHGHQEKLKAGETQSQAMAKHTAAVKSGVIKPKQVKDDPKELVKRTQFKWTPPSQAAHTS